MEADEYRRGDFLKTRIADIVDELSQIVETSNKAYSTPALGQIHFHLENITPPDEMRSRVRRFLLPFTIHREFTPQIRRGYLNFLEFANAYDAVASLNLWRPIIYNQSDFVYYDKIHNYAYQLLTNRNEDAGPFVSVMQGKDRDVTEQWIEVLSVRRKQIKLVKSRLDFDFLYNGLLQHSDADFFSRYDELNEGRISEILIKHTMALDYIVNCLRSYAVTLQFSTATNTIGFHWGP